MWPPLVTDEQLIRKRPPRAPYLSTPPAVIAIDVGRQLFVDGYLVEWTNATRTFHRAISRGIVLHLPRMSASCRTESSRLDRWASTMWLRRPFSGGAWYDDCTRRFILHYRCRYEYPGMGMGCVAFSRDGVHWRRPNTTLRQELRPNRGCKNCPTVRDPPNRIECATLTESFTTGSTTPRLTGRNVEGVTKSRSIAPLTLWNSARWRPLVSAAAGEGGRRNRPCVLLLQPVSSCMGILIMRATCARRTWPPAHQSLQGGVLTRPEQLATLGKILLPVWP